MIFFSKKVFVKYDWFWGLAVYGFPLVFFAQMTDSQKYQMIQSYLLQREYEKALPLLQDVYEVAPQYWFESYYETLVNIKKYTDAEKLIAKQLKKFPYRSDYYVYWGNLYALQSHTKKAKEYFEKAIKKLPNDISVIVLTAKQFMKHQMIEEALKVYDKGQALTRNPFHYERAEIYQQTKDYKALINVYLDVLYTQPGEIYNVQNQLQSLLAYNTNDTTQILQPVLKQEIIKRLQKYPDHSVYSELLIYLLTQQGEYEQAFIQAKALDKRLNDEGMKLFQFCQICTKNQQFHIAEKCFEEILKRGKNHPFYKSARLESLQNKYWALIYSEDNTNVHKVQWLKTQMYQYIQENKNASSIYTLVLNLADVYARYSNEFDRADSLLRNFIDRQQMSSDMKAIFKLKLADVYVLQNKLWEAILLCMQVEKDFKYEALGQEAQYKRAKISFYSGEFKLAKSQADILKGATSKLIANDALQLSILISNALFNDSTGMPLRYFAKADLLIFQNKLEAAIQTLDSINLKFTDHSLEDDIFYQKASIYEMKKEWAMAEQMYLNILQYYPEEMYADDALMRLARLYQYSLKDKQKAMTYYLKLLTDYPGSVYVPEARKMYRLLRGDEMN